MGFRLAGFLVLLIGLGFVVAAHWGILWDWRILGCMGIGIISALLIAGPSRAAMADAEQFGEAWRQLASAIAHGAVLGTLLGAGQGVMAMVSATAGGMPLDEDMRRACILPVAYGLIIGLPAFAVARMPLR